MLFCIATAKTRYDDIKHAMSSLKKNSKGSNCISLEYHITDQFFPIYFKESNSKCEKSK